jgi:bifunctional non-homologous end joining protein LigD
VTWGEVEQGVEIDQFRVDNVRKRLAEQGDLWKPLLEARGRVPLETLFA